MHALTHREVPRLAREDLDTFNELWEAGAITADLLSGPPVPRRCRGATSATYRLTGSRRNGVTTQTVTAVSIRAPRQRRRAIRAHATRQHPDARVSVTAAPSNRALSRIARTGSRPRGAGRPSARPRASTARGSDPEPPPGESPRPALHLPAPLAAPLTFGCLTAEQRGEVAS